jgi:hypothetical protein
LFVADKTKKPVRQLASRLFLTATGWLNGISVLAPLALRHYLSIVLPISDGFLFYFKPSKKSVHQLANR